MAAQLPHRRMMRLGVALFVVCAAVFAPEMFASRADAHAPHPGLDFSMEIDTNGDTANDCGTGDTESHSCTVALNAPFRSREYLNSLGDIPAYRGLQLHFGFGGGVTPASDPESLWPGCVGPTFYYGSAYGVQTDFGHASCAVAGSSPSIAYTGLAGQIFFKCASDGTVDLMHGAFPAHTELTEIDTTRHAEGVGTDEVLTVTCTAPAPYPTDTDGDGCPDEKESGPDKRAGGQRNFFDQWDYFNPTGDGVNRIDDVLAVLQQYFVDQGDAGYTTRTDRTPLGPDPWNLGPPNGQQRLDDILAAVASYFDDCS